MTVGILQFLGTNCDRDVTEAVKLAGGESRYLWYKDLFEAKDFSALVVPGGFSHGDYLRCGALAAKAPALKSLMEAAKKGVPVLGICNGFQILCEAGLLPGALLRNEKGRFIDQWVELNTVSASAHFPTEKQFRLPIAHGEGRFFATADELKKIADQDQVWLSYRGNPNGSLDDIAGITNRQKNILALMPHPERAVAEWMGGVSGQTFFSQVCQ